jgi:pimeloyl-ACP methyl ester carboxylesterase
METHVENLFHVKIQDLNAAILCRKLAIDKALIIHDKNDQIIPYEQAERVAKNLKNCQLIPVENAGHYRILWHPEVIQLVEAAL